MARPGVAWQGAHADLFEDAMRVVPAIAKHRATNDPLMVNATYKAYLDTARELGVLEGGAWAVLSSAYSVWMQNLFSLYAEGQDVPVEAAIDSAVKAAAEWVCERG